MSRPKKYVTEEEIKARIKEKSIAYYKKQMSDPDKLAKKRERERQRYHEKKNDANAKIIKKTVGLKLSAQEIDLISADAKNNLKSFSAYINEIVSNHARSLIPVDDSQSSQNITERSVPNGD